jgi:hypothetical protein
MRKIKLWRLFWTGEDRKISEYRNKIRARRSRKTAFIVLFVGLLAITFLFVMRISPTSIYSPRYYLDWKPPQVEIEGIEEIAAHRGVIEFTIHIRDQQTGVRAVKILLDGNNTQYERELDPYPKEYREEANIDTSNLNDGQHQLIVDVVDASWRRNHNRLERAITTDNTPPVVELTLKPEVVTQGRTLMIAAKPNEPINIEGILFEKNAEFYENNALYRSLLGIPVHQRPGRYNLDITAEDEAGNRCQMQRVVQVVKGRFEKGFVSLPKGKKQLLTDNEAQKLDLAKRSRAYSQFEPEQLWQGKSIRPAEGRISSSFGKQRVYNNGVRVSTHLGLDIANATGTPVKAANSGVVALAERLPISGYCVIINHGQRVFSSYAHLNRVYVNEDDEVEKGQIIGEIGTTGQSTGPHLHWGLRVSGVQVDPSEWTERDFSYY